jgi:hypothetical protein
MAVFCVVRPPAALGYPAVAPQYRMAAAQARLGRREIGNYCIYVKITI